MTDRTREPGYNASFLLAFDLLAFKAIWSGAVPAPSLIVTEVLYIHPLLPTITYKEVFTHTLS